MGNKSNKRQRSELMRGCGVWLWREFWCLEFW